MRSTFFLPALAALALAVPTPQDIDIDVVEAAADPVFATAAVAVASQSATFVPVSAQASAAASAISTAPASAGATAAADSKRSLEARDGNCAVQPAGSWNTTWPDTPEAFLGDRSLQRLSKNANAPVGYKEVFRGLNASLSASNYMGLYTLTSYSVVQCQSHCDQAEGCEAFNLYAERDPSLDPNANSCPNPPSITNFKCTLWGAPVCAEEATNFGQWRDSFEVVITASNGYNKNAPPAAINGYNGPYELGGAINAPLTAEGYNTYMGVKYYPFSQKQGYTPATCAAACTSQTTYNQAHPAADGTWEPCVFFNSYILAKNDVPQGLYCSLYNQSWHSEYATNYGQYRGSDYYSVSDSYSYVLSPPTSSDSSSSTADN